MTSRSETSLPDTFSFHHIGVAAHNAEEPRRLYRDLLGYRLVERRDFPSQKVEVVLYQDARGWVEVLIPTEADSAVGRFLAKRGAGLHHICYAVADLNRAVREVRRLEFELVHETPEPGVWGPVVFLHPKAAGGVMIELLQLTRGGDAGP